MHHDSLPARKRYTGLAGSADALALARLAAETKPLAVITATAQDAQRLLEEIAWFAPSLRVGLLPDWETLPYDQFSPHADLVSERLSTLYYTEWALKRGVRLEWFMIPEFNSLKKDPEFQRLLNVQDARQAAERRRHL